MKKYQITISILAAFFALIPNFSFAAAAIPVIDASLYNQLKGLIILKVEAKGEAYYMHPRTKSMYYLGRPDDAYAVMRDQGIGITNANLARIPVGAGPNTLKGAIDLNFTAKQLGVIFLQVEAKGEAWYVYPKDKKRYYLGRPNDAYNVMRTLGLGVSNSNFARLTGTTAEKNPLPYMVGYRTYTFTISDSKYGQTQIPVSFWYPTDAKPGTFVYKTVGGDLKPWTYTSSVAVSASIKQDTRPYPLALFFHGAQTCGTQSVFFAEHLASQGFIVAAPDFPDDAPQCSSIGKKPAPYFVFLQSLQALLKIDEIGMIDLLRKNYRVPGATKILHAILALHDSKDSCLWNTIDKNKIAASGHSYGGETSLGLLGAHPDKTFKDSRFKVAVLFSAPVFPYSENNIATVTVPIMLIQGDDNDDLDQYGNARKDIYANASGPKYFLKLGNGASHGTFFNGVCTPYSTIQECQKQDQFVQVINTYATAFLNKYLNFDAKADAALNETASLLKVYEKNAP